MRGCWNRLAVVPCYIVFVAWNLTALFSLKTFIHISLIAMAALLAMFGIHHADSYWVLISATTFFLAESSGTLYQRERELMQMGLMAAGLIFMIDYCMSQTMSLVLFLLFFTGASTYLSARRPADARSLFAINFLMLLAFCLPSQPTHAAFVLLGALIVMLVRFIISVCFQRDEWLQLEVMTIASLNQLSHSIFACFLQSDYATRGYFYERKLHIAKRRYLKAMLALRQIDHRQTKARQVSFLDNCYANLLCLAELRHRITDYTLFDLCSHEMKEVQMAIEKIFTQMKKFPTQTDAWDSHLLSEKILNFEQLYQNILQVSASEPFVFMLFIADLKLLRDLVEAGK